MRLQAGLPDKLAIKMPSMIRRAGGARRDRTDDLMLAKHALSQLSYGPERSAAHSQAHALALEMVGLGRLELPTSRLSSARSNQLSYKPELMTPPGADSKVPKARAGLSGKKEKRRRRRSRMIGLTGHCSEEIR